MKKIKTRVRGACFSASSWLLTYPSLNSILLFVCLQEPVSPAADLTAAADQFSDPVLVRLCRQCSQWISKVSIESDRRCIFLLVRKPSVHLGVAFSFRKVRVVFS